jgi:4-hydroxybenzoate polyprenyltransferase/phosphoserine phosphatase
MMNATDHRAPLAREPQGRPAEPVPLCVDLDGTLLAGDSLYELLFAGLRRRPALVFLALLWIWQGKAAFKARLAEAVDPRGLAFRFHDGVVAYLAAARAEGRRLVLATAAHRRVAEAIADELGLFDEVIATEDGRNLRGAAKAAELVARYGRGGFDYAGNDRHDLPVWAEARRAIVVEAGRSTIAEAARRVATVERVFPVAGFAPRPLLKAMRLHQWAKNLLVFLPLLAAHRFDEAAALLQAGAAFLAMGLVASGGYLANDLLDVQADRRHRSKFARPFAAATLPLPFGPPLVLALVLPGLLLAALVSLPLAAWVGVYLAATLTYSLWLKQKVLIDVFFLAGLYTHRVLAGGIATGIVPSFWLLALSVFVFLSLALLKRYSELIKASAAETGTPAAIRGYRAEDLEPLAGLGTASAVAAALVLALYVDSDNVRALYRSPELLWLCCPLLLYWLSRMWIGARRGVIDDDPLVFALRDRISLVVLGLTLALAAAGAMVRVSCVAGLGCG